MDCHDLCDRSTANAWNSRENYSDDNPCVAVDCRPGAAHMLLDGVVSVGFPASASTVMNNIWWRIFELNTALRRRAICEGEPWSTSRWRYSRPPPWSSANLLRSRLRSSIGLLSVDVRRS